MSDKCPFCGEPYMESIQKYGCDFLASTPIRSQGCYARQIANLQASRDMWRTLAVSLRRIITTLALPNADKELVRIESELADNTIAALKAAGEWEDLHT